MSEIQVKPETAMPSRLARWMTIAGIVGACVSMFVPWLVSGDYRYVPGKESLGNFSAKSLASFEIWPFWLLLFYGFLGGIGGTRWRRVLTWVACVVMGLAMLTFVCLWGNFMMGYLRLTHPGSRSIAVLSHISARGWAHTAVFVIAGFLYLALPLLRPLRAALPAGAALCGAVFLIDFLGCLVDSLKTGGLSFDKSPGQIIFALASAVILAGGIWEWVIESRRGVPEEETP